MNLELTKEQAIDLLEAIYSACNEGQCPSSVYFVVQQIIETFVDDPRIEQYRWMLEFLSH